MSSLRPTLWIAALALAPALHAQTSKGQMQPMRRLPPAPVQAAPAPVQAAPVQAASTPLAQASAVSPAMAADAPASAPALEQPVPPQAAQPATQTQPATPMPPPAAVPPQAQAAAPIAAYRTGRVDFGLAAAKLTSGQPNWFDVYARGHLTAKPGTVLQWGLASERHFDERGTVGSLGLVQDINARWYATAGISGGSASFHNQYRVDAGLHHKWGQDLRLITGIAVMRSKSQDDIHRDRALTLSQMAYLPNDVLLQGGAIFNHSDPGSVNSARGFVAITQGREKQHYASARLEHGREAYLPAAALQNPAQADVAFSSTELHLEWRHWLSQQYGYVLGARYYHNPYYNRTGLSAAVFVDF